jgi:hypothetical protein
VEEGDGNVEEEVMFGKETVTAVVPVEDNSGAAPGKSVAEELAVMNLEELNTDVEHASRAQKRRARRKRTKDSARAMRRSLRLREKEEAGFELPEDKAARVQQAKFDFSGASRRLRNALSHSYLISDNFSSSDETESILDIAAACGASEEEVAGISGEAAMPPTAN